MVNNKTQEIVQKAISDSDFAGNLRDQAIRAIHAGAGSDEWKDYFSQFAASPEELQSMSAGAEGAAACTCHSRTVITTSTPLCTTTTTTTSA
ncbi:hypothetical protein [Salipiger sp. CCB-MM3]|uniref:hypothetical protein n=1 Tax=Salipiger sp. CCB-MM3 TaxID=1792508 RepID=UPI0012FAA57B|nr:hypothetical protein [Salipiger sp. CCB-MM3]